MEDDNKKPDVQFIKNEKELKKLQKSLKSERDERVDLLQSKEIERLCNENKRLRRENQRLRQPNEKLVPKYLDFQEKYEQVSEECRKLRERCKILAKRIEDTGLPDGVESGNDSTVVPTPAITLSSHGVCNMWVNCTEEGDYKGLFEFRKEDITVIIQHLVIDLKPHIALRLLPDLPAYILFMCIRHTDILNDDETLKSLVSAYLKEVKHVVKEQNDIESSVLWLNNTLRLLNNMKQYSGDKPFLIQNTPRQNEQCLRNFDLFKYQVALDNTALYIFKNIVNQLRKSIQALTVPALLEHEAVYSVLSSNNAIEVWPSFRGEQRELGQQKFDELLSKLSSMNKALQRHNTDPEIVIQLFKQLFYFICASALNNLLFRKDLCQWTKGMQIRRNLSQLEDWARDHQLSPAAEELEPIIQAAELLQSPKSDDHVNSVCEMCNKLSASQITIILRTYTPANEDDEKVPSSFINKVQTKLSEHGMKNERLLKALEYPYDAQFPFKPSNIRLEDIDIPGVLNLPMLKKI